MTPDVIIQERIPRQVMKYLKERSSNLDVHTYKVSEATVVDSLFYVDFTFLGRTVTVRYEVGKGFGIVGPNNEPDELLGDNLVSEKKVVDRLIDIFCRTVPEEMVKLIPDYLRHLSEADRDKLKTYIVFMQQGWYCIVVRMGRVSRTFYYIVGKGFTSKYTMKPASEPIAIEDGTFMKNYRRVAAFIASTLTSKAKP